MRGRSDVFITHMLTLRTLLFFRMEGVGEFVFPTGTKYVGELKDGM